MTRVFVTGGSGGLGRYVVDALKRRGVEPYAPSRKAFDVTTAKFTGFRFMAPQVVIHLAAAADVAACETNPENAIAINVQGTTHIARECVAIGARLVYMSTDAVFSGSGPHAESHTPSPASVYGWSKFAGEQTVAMLGDKGLIIRANFFSRHCSSKLSFAAYVLQEAIARHDFVCYENVISTPVFAETLAEHIVDAALDNAHGILHIASSDSVNRVEQAAMICEAYGLPTRSILIDRGKKYDGRLSTSAVCGTVQEEITKMAKAEPL